jgi:hypothetical protein
MLNYVLVLVGLLLGGVINPTDSNTNTIVFEEEKKYLFEELNAFRRDPNLIKQKYGIKVKGIETDTHQLRYSYKLDSIAQAKAEWCLKNRKITHYDKRFSNGEEHTWQYYNVTECLDIVGGDELKQCNAFFILDQGNPGYPHREAILRKSRKFIGIGIAQDKIGTSYIVYILI